MDGPSFWQTAGSALLGAFVGGSLALVGVIVNGFREQITAQRSRVQFLTLEMVAVAQRMVENVDRYVRYERKSSIINMSEFATFSNDLSKYATELRWLTRGTELRARVERLLVQVREVGNALGRQDFDEASFDAAKRRFEEAVLQANSEGEKVTQLDLFAARAYFKRGKREITQRLPHEVPNDPKPSRFSWAQLMSELKRGW